MNLRSLISKKIIALFIIIAAPALTLATAGWYITGANNKKNQSSEKLPNKTIDKASYDINSPSSYSVLVNKGRRLPSAYQPKDLIIPNVPLRSSDTSAEMKLRAEAARSLESMFLKASKAGLNLLLVSGHRSYSSQAAIYNRNVKNDGTEKTDMTSARPGHSEHQTGLAADIGAKSRTCELDICFGNTPEGRWLAADAHKYGFIVRYAEGKSSLTGYDFEPWHLRYVGKDLAGALQAAGKTMEEFFGLPAYSTYAKDPQQLN